MKTISLFITILFFVCFGNVLNAQTIKQKLNNQDIDKNRTIYKSSDVLETEKSSSSSANIDHDIKKHPVLDKQFGKITIISPNSIIGNTSNKPDKNLENGIDYKAKKQSYRLKYHQQRKQLGDTKIEGDE
tara:strand:+ start:720 stop:1109 length:390 start_codon:yes stop_codon:yes gene_type:complete